MREACGDSKQWPPTKFALSRMYKLPRLQGKGRSQGSLGDNKPLERVKGVGLSCFWLRRHQRKRDPNHFMLSHGDLDLVELGPAGVEHISVATGAGDVCL